MTFGPRPTIKPWLPRLWRDPDTLQIGVQPGNGVLVSGVDLSTATWLAGLDGSRSESEVFADASVLGLEIGSAVRILGGLSRAGVLVGGPPESDEHGDGGPLLPELVGLSEAATTASSASRVLAKRGRRHVLIDGATRIGVPLGALLAASGVGGVAFDDQAPARRCDASVGGLSLDDEGDLRSMAAQRAIRRTSSMTQSHAGPTQDRPDLIVLCRPWTAHDPLHRQVLKDRGAHLPVAARYGTVVIGPLVVPGRTSCLHCAELHRTDRDPRWPVVAGQLAAGPSRAIHEPPSVLAALAAALAAAQVLDFLDGGPVPDIVEATLELHPPDWQIRRRSWPPHVECGCIESLPDPRVATGLS